MPNAIRISYKGKIRAQAGIEPTTFGVLAHACTTLTTELLRPYSGRVVTVQLYIGSYHFFQTIATTLTSGDTQGMQTGSLIGLRYP